MTVDKSDQIRIEKLQAQLKERDELLRECADFFDALYYSTEDENHAEMSERIEKLIGGAS